MKKTTATPEETSGIDALSRAEAGLVVEFIACEKLEVGSNRLGLTLVDGDPVRVADARVTVVKEERPAFLPKLKIDPIPGSSSDGASAARRSSNEGVAASAPQVAAAPAAVPQPVRRMTPPNPVPDTAASSSQYQQSTLPRSAGAADLFRSLPPPPSSLSSPPQVHLTIEPPTPLRRVPQPNSITDPDFFSTEPRSTSSNTNIPVALNSPSLNGPAPPRPPRPGRSLLLQRATLHPTHSSRGQHKSVLAPCFPYYASTTSYVKSVLSSKELLMNWSSDWTKSERRTRPHRTSKLRTVNLITFSEDTHEVVGPSGAAARQKPKRPTLEIPGSSSSGARSHSAEWSSMRSSSYHL
ncbi:hypothetical protein FRC01_002355 [Tulasnella sp. 417]|nr:hypothetical protein FRC01_002355 [Tulasnella sp. 417]